MPQIVIDSGPAKGQRVNLPSGAPFIAGRDTGSDLRLEDPLVSRRHFRILVDKSPFEIEDLASVNGTFVNGSRLSGKSKLLNGDRIQAGETVLAFFERKVEDPLIGKTISGFEVLERVGSGGMGTVYKARQVSLDRLVALKVLAKELAANRRFSELFHREARAAGQINHPSIVQVYDVDTVQFEGGEVTFFAMEYMPAGSVEDLLAREKRLGVDQMLKIALDTARGIEFAETRGLVHRDIKPGNLMVSETGAVKIGDLGIARRAESGNSKVSQRDGISGSPHYIAPEQAQGKDLDSGADIYSLGITMFHILAGRPPFIGATAKELVLKHVREKLPPLSDFRNDVPASVIACIGTMTRKERDERFATASALVDALEAVQHELRAEKAPPLAKRVGAYVRSHLPLFGFLVLLLGLGLGAGMVYNHIDARNRVAAVELQERRGNLEGRIDRTADALEGEDVQQARKRFDEQVRPLLLAAADDEQLADLVATARDLLRRVEAAEAEVDRLAREEQARKRLAEILQGYPPDELPYEERRRRIDAVLVDLKQFLEAHRGLEVAEEALAKQAGLKSIRRNIVDTLREAGRNFSQLDVGVRALLDIPPPRDYRKAGVVRGLQRFLKDYAGAPRARDAEARLREVEKAMEAEVEAALEEARGVDKARAILMLEKVKNRVDGKALERVEKEIEGLRGGQ